MFISSQANVSIESLRQESAGKPVVLIYPNVSTRATFISKYLANADEGLMYYCIKETTPTLAEWLGDLAAEFKRVLPNFGERLQAALTSSNAVQMGAAFAEDLNSSNTQPVIIFIDGLEYMSSQFDLSLFIDAFIEHIQPHIQLAFTSRLASYQPWTQLIQRGIAVVLGTERHRTDLRFTAESSPKPQLDVLGFGRGVVRLDGQEITHWDGLLPRALFFYLVDHPLVTREDIFRDIWPSVPGKDATDIFHVTKHKITEILNRRHSRDLELTQYKQAFYIPSDKLVRHYDVETFSDAITRAGKTDDQDEAKVFLHTALDLYKAPFLEGLEAEWVQRRRAELSYQYSEALIHMGRILHERKVYQEALEHYQKALTMRPEREDVHRAVVELLLALGERDQARQHYQLMERDIYEKLGIQPSQETRELLARLN